MILRLLIIYNILINCNWSRGFDVKNVQQLNSNIVGLMKNVSTKVDCETLVSCIRMFVGGLHVSMLQILHLYNKTESLQVGKCIYDAGKPSFIDKNLNIKRLETTCKWEINNVRYFRKIMKDANNTWTNFVSAYLKWKDKPIIPFEFKMCSITC